MTYDIVTQGQAVRLALPVLLLAAWMAAAPAARAQPEGGTLPHRDAEAGRPFVTAFGPAVYDAPDQNWGVVEDARGVVYVANNGGVLAFDGVAWSLVPLPDRGAVRSLAVDDDGRIWVGGTGDLGYLAPDRLGRTTFVSLKAAVPAAHRGFADVWETHAAPGGVYFTTADVLLRWDGSAMQAWAAGETPLHVSAVVEGTLYLRQWGRGLLRMERTAAGDSLRLVPGGERFAETRLYVMLPFGDGRLLLGTREDGLFLFDPDAAGPARFVRFRTEADDILARGTLYQPGAVLPDGTFALGTISEGLVVVDRDGRLVQHLDRTAGLPNETVYGVYPDASGNLWLGLDDGVARVARASGLTRYDASNGLTSAPLSVERYAGHLYVGTSTGLLRLDPAAGRLRPVAGPNAQVWALLPTPGGLLAAYANEGVYRIGTEPPRAVPLRRSVEDDYVANALHAWDRAPGVVFVALQDGLAALHYDEAAGMWDDLGRVPGLDEEVWWLLEDAAGALWGGLLEGGLVRVRLPTPDGPPPDLRAAEVTRFGAAHGLPPGILGADLVEQTLYAFGLGETVHRFEAAAGRFVPDGRFDGARTGHPLSMLGTQAAADGSLWLTSAYGAPVAARRQEDGRYAFERLHGLRAERIAGVYPEPDGVVWMLGERLVRYEPHRAVAAPARLPLIRRVAVGEDDLRYGGMGAPIPLQVPHRTEALHFAYAAPGAVVTPRFRTRLAGFDAGWSAWTTDAEREYTNLPPGDYTFEVEAEGRGTAAYALTVLPPWYRTGWAYGLYALLLGLAVFGLDRVQRRRLVKRERQRAAVEQQRLRAEAAERELTHAKEIERAYHALDAAHTQLQRTQAQLVQQEKMASLGQLTSGIAHEIKNPLNFVNNFAQLTEELVAELRDETDPEEVEALLEDIALNAAKIREHGQRADGIVRSMMQHARGSAGRRETVDVNRFVDEYVELAYHGQRARLPGFAVEVVRRYAPDAGTAVLVPQEVGRVLLNLLANAFDALAARGELGDGQPPGAEARRVTVTTRRANGHVAITVADNGPGIPPDVRDKIFEPFFTTKPTGEGTGLGLYLSFDIVTQGHGGTLEVHSAEGEGARFVVTLPEGER